MACARRAGCANLMHLGLGWLFMDTSEHLLDESPQLLPRVKTRCLSRHHVFDPTYIIAVHRFSRGLELHDKGAIAWQSWFSVVHLLTSFLGSVFVTFPLSRAREEYKEGNGKGTAANGKDFGKDLRETVIFVVRRGRANASKSESSMQSNSYKLAPQKPYHVSAKYP